MVTKTDNTYFADKVLLRINNLPKGKCISVLDCFGGMGRTWKAVSGISDKKIVRTPIDQRNDLKHFHLHGDNVKVMAGMDLKSFQVIDLDAYGLPVDQLQVLFNQKYTGIVFVTFIQSMMGRLSKKMLIDIGFSDDMIKKSPTLCSRGGFNYFLQWLSINGVTKIRHRSKNRKHYVAFQLC